VHDSLSKAADLALTVLPLCSKLDLMVRVFFLGIGTFYTVLGLRLGMQGAPLIWLGLRLLVVGVAYFLNAPGFLGKRVNGSFAPLELLMNAPFLCIAWMAWVLRCWRRNEPPFNEVALRVFVGRMARAS
jgi:hypothetical protein